MFLDTSLLVKLYYEEEGTAELDQFLTNHAVEVIYLSEISKIEFNSAIRKKVRMQELLEPDAISLQEGFQNDYDRYQFILLNQNIVDRASNLVVKYGPEGLRTLDAIQLSCVIEKKEHISIAKSADQKLVEAFKQEGIDADE